MSLQAAISTVAGPLFVVLLTLLAPLAGHAAARAPLDWRNRMTAIGGIVCGLALIEAGWMTFDGGRALIVGDFVTPKSGPYAGELGPWTKLVEKVGIAPRSTLMKCIFFVHGIGWLAILVCFLAGLSWAKWAMLVCAAGALWYLPFGTLFSVIQIALLISFFKGASS